jgi:hypothetical protein
MAKRKKQTDLFMSNAPQPALPDTPDETDTPAETPATDDVIPLPAKGPNSYKEWLSRIKQSQKTIEELQPEWDRNQRRYLLKKRSSQHEEELLVPSLFTNVEQKKSQLTAQNPYVVVRPQHPDSAQAAPLMEAVINEQLGAAQPYGVDVMVMFEEVLSDALVPSGIFACHVGYESFIDGTKEVQTGTKPDPKWVAPPPAPVMPGMPPAPPPQPPMVPVMTTIPNVVFERYYMDRLSPSKLLIPEDFRQSDYDRAAWLGFEFTMDFYLAKRKWKAIPDDFDSFADDDDRLINADGDGRSKVSDKRKMVRGWMIYYHSAVFDKSVVHPYAQRCLVLLEGLKDKPVYHKDSPFQWQNDDKSLGGMMGFPVHIGALRYVSDSCFPPSDASMSRYQDEEISDGRSMMKLQRKRNIPMRLANVSTLKEGGLSKVERGIWGAVIPLDGEAFADGAMPIKDVQQTTYPQENFTFDNLANRDNQATWGLGAAPGGSIPQGTASTSATQSGAAQASSASRIGRERNKLMGWYARACEKLAVLYQHFMTDDQYVQMLGPDGAKVLTAWNKESIQGKFGFSILPNSSIDLSEQRSEELQWYNMVAKSPDIDHRALDTELVKSFGRDPAKLITPPQPPPTPKPELPHGITLNLDDKALNPLNPSFPLIISLLALAGVNIPATAVAQAQKQAAATGLPTAASGDVVNGQVPPPPPAPGAPLAPGAPPGPVLQHAGAPKADVVDAHQFDRSGALNGPGPKPTQ